MNSSPRGRGSNAATSSPDLAHLTLPQLREYRATLTQEEERISYWRRLVQARIDILQAQAKSVDSLAVADLARALGDTGTGNRRGALTRIRDHVADVPDLPGLGQLWSQAADPLGDPQHTQDVVNALEEAEHALTLWRGELHARLAEATSDLIARYALNPADCLDLVSDVTSDVTVPTTQSTPAPSRRR